ncbi:MAG: M13 family metallopeptidase [Clostridiales bacterium]|nr:M13 family metallopeptidase [Clostridiales bacterium]
MKKQLLALLLACSMLAASGCGKETSDTGPQTGGGIPWIDSDLKENITADMELSPKEDFHLYVNHSWLLENEIPEGYSTSGPFLDVYMDTTKKAQALLEDETIEGHEAALCRELYQTWMDWDQRNALGMEPVMARVKDIRSIQSIEELSAFLCDEERRRNVPAFLSCVNSVDLNDASSYVVDVVNDGLLLQDSAEYEKRTEQGERYEKAFGELGAVMLKKAGFSQEEAEKVLEQVLELETELAGGTLTMEEQMSPDLFERINNVYTMEELKGLCSRFPVTEMIRSQGYGNGERLRVTEPDYFTVLDGLYNEENLEKIKSYMLFKYLTSMAFYLDQEAFDAEIQFENTVGGSTGRLPDEEYSFEVVMGSLTQPLSRAYIEKYDASKEKQDIVRMCEEIIGVYRRMLEDQEWMSEETRHMAVEKLENIKINAVYPDEWEDYSGLSIEGLSLTEALNEIGDFETARDWNRTNQKADRDEWEMNTLESNAYYNPQNNSINILLGILGSEFYHKDMTEEQLYGGIGSVIGHEISHAFDTNGAQFDKEGNLSNWWTDEDLDAFKARADRLIAYYDGITAYGGCQVPGKNIQTEAIADMAGVKCLLMIAEKKEDFDYDSFFRQYASVWRRLSSPEFEYICLNQDSHPLHYLRTNATLQQYEEFYETYDIQPGDTMYLAPEERVAVW